MGKTYDSPATEKTLDRLAGRNRSLTSFKGIGRIEAWEGDKRWAARAAWMGRPPRELRVELLSSGRPLSKFATDGRYAYMISHAEGEYRRHRADDISLKRILSVPVQIDDILAFLSGRVPLTDYKGAALEKRGHGFRLILKKWGAVVQTIDVDPAHGGVTRTSRYAYDGTLVYEAVFGDFRTVNGFSIPFTQSYFNEGGDGFELSVDRFWANAEVPGSRFVLEPPEQRP